MSTTFGIMNPTFVKVPCRFCEWAREDGTDVNGKCDEFCSGLEEVATSPECNFSGVKGLLQMLGVPDEDIPCGSIPLENLPDFRRALNRLRNTDRSNLLSAPSQLPGGHAGVRVTTDEFGNPMIQRMGPACFFGGVSDERILAQIEAIDRVAQYAQEQGRGIVWS